MEGVKVEVISRETIKPSSPTPPHLSTHRLSFLDQINTSIYIPIFLFYSKNTEDHNLNETNRCLWLKNSLSKLLTYYYPFAGRFTESGDAITCNDEGVEFYEAQVECPLSQVLDKRDSDSLNALFPKEFFMKSSLEGSLLGVQVNFFECGGMSVSLSICHKIVDGCTLSDFLSDWASVARQPDAELQVLPMFIGMPNGPFNLPTTDQYNESAIGKSCTTKRFVINPSKIALLKANAAESGLPRISRVEVVTALLYKRAVAAASIANKDSLKKSSLVMMVNMRPRVVPPLPPKYAGNFTWFITTFNDGDVVNPNGFMGQVRNGVAELCNKDKNNLKMNDWLSGLPESLNNHLSALAQSMEEMDAEKIMVDIAYKFSSHCSFPYYEVDFGVGKPQWVGLANGCANRLFALMPTKDGAGIEAMVTLAEEEMDVFERDEELLAFASVSESIY